MQAIGYHISTFCVKVFYRSTCRGMNIYSPIFLFLFLEFNFAKEKKNLYRVLIYPISFSFVRDITLSLWFDTKPNLLKLSCKAISDASPLQSLYYHEICHSCEEMMMRLQVNSWPTIPLILLYC